VESQNITLVVPKALLRKVAATKSSFMRSLVEDSISMADSIFPVDSATAISDVKNALNGIRIRIRS
jgi:hypothetical protein